ncbi:hypothetical protein TrRE_jg10794 [Triparma retinervis]|uniref:Peptidase M50 domain-containing protein n=1 Tax=Triparma retinervis TaxID=2557542 RepID=A0A9W7DXB8_9STRA|nr:hypothetical protein TrRE_jg10794 [Triparma retinervis]
MSETVIPTATSLGLLAFVVLVHELGHFTTALAQGIKVSEFSVGFGPPLITFLGPYSVTYSLRILPFGGYVRFPDNYDQDEYRASVDGWLSRQELRKLEGGKVRGQGNAGGKGGGRERFKLKLKEIYDEGGVRGVLKWLNEGDENRSPISRILVLSGGVIANLLLSFTIFFSQAFLGPGIPQPTLSSGVKVASSPLPQSPSSGLLLAGDVITSLKGREVYNLEKIKGGEERAQEEVGDLIKAIRNAGEGEGMDTKRNPEAYDPDKIYAFFRVILTNAKAEDPSEMEVLNIGDDFEIVSSNKAHVSRIDPSVETWLVKDPSRTVDFINCEFPVNFIETLFYVQLSSSRHEETGSRVRLVEEERISPLQWHKQLPEPFHVYMGFNPSAVSAKESRLFVYSRGRLIQFEGDFRKLLRLKNYESDYQQGLTVIVNDTNSQLVLDPTKEGIRPCPALWETLSEVVNAYFQLSIRVVLGNSRSRFNLKMQEAISDRADELFALTDLFLPLRLLDLNELPVVERQKKQGTKGHFRLDKIMIGEHSIQFNAIEKKTKQGYALELQPEDDDDKEWDIFGPAPTPRSASRKSKDGNPINYNESTIAINHTLTESFGGSSKAGSKSKRATADEKKSAELYKKLKREIRELLAQYNGNDDLTFTPEFRAKYDSDFLQLVESAKTGADYYDIVTRFEHGITDDFKCRRWVGDEGNVDACSCYRCSLTRDQWKKEMRRAKNHKTEEAYAKHLLEKLAEFDHYATDGFRTIDERGRPVQYLEGLNERGGGGGGGSSERDSRQLEKLNKEMQELKQEKTQLAREKDALAREKEALRKELSQTKSSFLELQSSISLLFDKSRKESPEKRRSNKELDERDENSNQGLGQQKTISTKPNKRAKI